MIRYAHKFLLQSFVLSLAMVFLGCELRSTDLRIAVSSNFIGTLSSIVSSFESDTGYSVTIVSGSTGKHYAQIIQGAPIDVFLAADTLRPALLEQDGYAVEETRFTYAVGRLVLWCPGTACDPDLERALSNLADTRLAIANPEIAPYGRAAKQVLERRRLWDENDRRIVRGENVAQVFHFVQSGNADWGFVAYSQLLGSQMSPEGAYWLVPENEYEPIEQQGLLLADTPAARAFLKYITGERARTRIRANGYFIN